VIELRLEPIVGIRAKNFLGDLRIDQVYNVHGFADAEIDGQTCQSVGIGRGEPFFRLQKVDGFLERDFRRFIEIDA
jgi:hypothetical protein